MKVLNVNDRRLALTGKKYRKIGERKGRYGQASTSYTIYSTSADHLRFSIFLAHFSGGRRHICLNKKKHRIIATQNDDFIFFASLSDRRRCNLSSIPSQYYSSSCSSDEAYCFAIRCQLVLPHTNIYVIFFFFFFFFLSSPSIPHCHPPHDDRSTIIVASASQCVDCMLKFLH